MITFDQMRGCVVLNVIIIVGRAAVNCDDVNKVLKKTFQETHAAFFDIFTWTICLGIVNENLRVYVNTLGGNKENQKSVYCD